MATDTFISDRVAVIRDQIVAYEDALLALAASPETYVLDTGQTKQSVTRVNITTLNNTLGSLYNRYVTLNARLGVCGVTLVRRC